MTVPEWGGRRLVEVARPYMALRLPATCGQCGGPVTSKDEWAIGHIKSRLAYPELTWEPANWRHEHRRCSDRSGHDAIREKVMRELGVDASFPATAGTEEAPLRPFSLPEGAEAPFEIPEHMSWAAFCETAPAWLLPWLELDENSNPPLAISPLHPDAVGSLALPDPERSACTEGAVAWIERTEGKTLRWWQRLGIILKLQCDADGRLLKRDVTETGPRRAGKSVGLRGLALWRMEFGSALFGERQEIIHTGSDMAVCRKAQKEAWRWAEAHWGAKAVTRGNGKEAIERESDGSVWYVRAQDATYGWDTTLALIDEGWDVKPETVDEGIDPSMMGRQSPQKVMTSTSHRRARSTMKTALLDGLTSDNPKVMVLWWGALPTDDPGDPETWRKASPYWDDDRHEFVSSKYDKALAGEQDPELDDPDPMRGFACQFLNQWNLKERRAPRGEPVASPETWATLEDRRTGLPVPDAVAIESWFDGGVSVATAWRADERAVVEVLDFPDLPSAVAAATALRCSTRLIVGASLMEDAALKGVAKVAGKGRTGNVVQELGRLLAGDQLRHRGGQHLAAQVLDLRTVPGADGPRVVSSGRADAVKAAVWAAQAARSRTAMTTGVVAPSHVA